MKSNCKMYIVLTTVILMTLMTNLLLPVFSTDEVSHKAASNPNVINYARTLFLTLVDSGFRSSWVIDPQSWDKKIQKSFDSLAKVKIGSTQRDVKEILNNPKEIRNNGKIWIYGTPRNNGTYGDLLEVFFDDKTKYVTGVISFTSKNIVEKIGINIGDSIDKIIAAYGEPVDEKDFIEDPDNKEYMGLYYLYPRSGIGFLIGQDKLSKNLLVHGILVFGKS